jgi:hypothetical protein
MIRRATLAAVLAALALPAAASAAPPTVANLSAKQGEAIPSSTVVATFNDAALIPPLCGTGQQATVDWGDGTGSQAASVTGPDLLTCHFSVRAGHTYTSTGTFTVTVNVTGGGNPGASTGTATVVSAKLTALSPVAISAVAGQQFSGVVGGFSDAFTAVPTSDFTTTVDWGDGTPASAGTVEKTSLAGTFVVDGSHTYATAGSHPFTVTVIAKGGGTATLSGTANVAASGTPKSAPGTFKMSLRSIVRRRGRAYAIRLGCPQREASCRGKVALYWLRGGKRRKLGQQLFLLAGGSKATLDIVIRSGDARRLKRAKTARLQAVLVARDPSANRAAAQSVTKRVRTR